MSKNTGSRTFFAFVIRLLGITLMVEGLGIFVMSMFEPLVMLMAIFLFLSGQCGFMLPSTVSWHLVFENYESRKSKKKVRRKFVETRLEKIIPKKRKPAEKKRRAKRRQKAIL